MPLCQSCHHFQTSILKPSKDKRMQSCSNMKLKFDEAAFHADFLKIERCIIGSNDMTLPYWNSKVRLRELLDCHPLIVSAKHMCLIYNSKIIECVSWKALFNITNAMSGI